jgi:phospholipid/cholesterol/gamma-HCH transport system substrate-binding protein
MAAPRWYRTCRGVAVSFAATALVVASASCTAGSKEQAAGYCAIMPDSVGLYVDNPVTQMGVRIGKITALTPATSSVRVDFSVDERRLPNDVKAVTRSSSILADRSLELLGNYSSGAQLSAGECIPLDRSFTPKSLSEVIGSSTNFLNSINPDGSTNVGDTIAGIGDALRNEGPGINKLLTTASTLLDSPDQAIGDIGSSIVNLARFTQTLTDLYPTLQQVLQDANQIAPDLVETTWGATKTFEGIVPTVSAVADLETQLGGEIQQTLDVVSVAIRKLSPRAPYYASLLNVTPRLINGLANFAASRQNTGAAAFTIRYRPPLYRIRTPDGAFTCGYMNAAMPGSCANVAGMPYAVDVALLQYVLTQAANR